MDNVSELRTEPPRVCRAQALRTYDRDGALIEMHQIVAHLMIEHTRPSSVITTHGAGVTAYGPGPRSVMWDGMIKLETNWHSDQPTALFMMSEQLRLFVNGEDLVKQLIAKLL